MKKATTLPDREINAVRAFKSVRHRLHLYNGKITDWFDRSELVEMMKKYEGRIITIGTEDVV